VAPPIARATLAPTPTKMRETISEPYVAAYADPMLLAMAMTVNNYGRLPVNAKQEVARVQLSIRCKLVCVRTCSHRA
jgi:hypothetical protein